MAYYNRLVPKQTLPTKVQPEVMPMMGRVGRYTNKMHHMRKHFLKAMQSYAFSEPFMDPVDTELLDVPTYHEIIKNPMDLRTIIKRVDNRYYNSVEDLNNDIRLVIRNCYTFNLPTALVFKHGLQLESYFLNVLDKMPVGAEVLSDSGRHQKSLCKHLCTKRIEQIQKHLEKGIQLAGQHYFHRKLLVLRQKVKGKSFSDLQELDTQLDQIITFTKERVIKMRKLFELTSIKPLDNKMDIPNEYYHPISLTKDICSLPKCGWEHCLLDCIQERTYLRSTLRRHMLFNTEMIHSQICAQNDLTCCSEDEEEDTVHPIADDAHLMAVQKKYNCLPLECKAGLLHIVEQCATSYKMHGDYKFDILLYAPVVVRTILDSLEKFLSISETDSGYSTTEPKKNGNNEKNENHVEKDQQLAVATSWSPTEYAQECKNAVEPADEPFLPDDISSDDDDVVIVDPVPQQKPLAMPPEVNSQKIDEKSEVINDNSDPKQEQTLVALPPNDNPQQLDAKNVSDSNIVVDSDVVITNESLI